ncbi:MAG: bifunctional riboflavin kinase/FAD synthetase [Bacteroidales bacterium]|nr:bifunctional riboflavin kinase/FAD synthetase [Bacteroidales bacterium]
MKTYQSVSGFKGSRYPVVTVGTFDGLHVGHQKIIQRMKDIAMENGGETILVTFDPHPRQVLNSNPIEIRFINTRSRKLKLLEQFGIDHIIVIPFTREFAQTSSDDFVRNYLVDALGMKKLIVGYDHHFGRNREGNYLQLQLLGEKYGFLLEEIEAQYINGVAVSSTKIRHALMEGDVSLANKMLGYPYSISGTIIEGNKLGRTIGFPTANLDVEDQFKLIAAGGVYACKVELHGVFYYGMANIGTRPTVGINGLVTEVHIFDFDEDIYGNELTIYFTDRIRDERKFESLAHLKEQLLKDKIFTLAKIDQTKA